MSNKGQAIAGLVGGAALMFLLDPDRGARRRALLRDRAVSVRLVVSSSPEGVPSLQGGRRRESRAELLQENWAPATRLAAGAIGGAAVYRGLRSEGVGGPALIALGGMLLARALTNLPAERLIGLGAGRRAVDVQRAIHVDAPINRVWELWSDIERWPRFMSHVKEVRRTGDGRSHWVAAGPAGTSVEWEAVTTQWIPEEVIAWKSVEGSTVEHSGRVLFRRDDRGGTLIEVRMSYNPPAGAVGHTVASLFGADPESAMEEDLQRLKSLLEDGKTTGDRGQGRLHNRGLGLT
ncbi:MAG TPA: SRPBCC family protein [Gemmatimonadales bacterium]|nr:SRPBCC family protein [Gemmatimonadales bacterium]